MTPDEQVKDLLTAIGAISETLRAFYDALLDRGFDEDQAITLTIAFMRHIVPTSGSNG